MASSACLNQTPTSDLSLLRPESRFLSLSLSFSVAMPTRSPPSRKLPLCLAAKSQTGPVKKRSSPAGKKEKRARKGGGEREKVGFRDVEIVEECEEIDGGSSVKSRSVAYHPSPMPKPPAGFVVDNTGRVLMASDKRIVTLVDSASNSPLECVVRRVFESSKGDECMLVCPVDTPILVFKSTNFDGWSAVPDDQIDAILPTVAYSLAKIHMHLVHSGFCYTARGGFCYSEDDIFDLRPDDDQDMEGLGLPSEGIEITCFHLDGAHYMIYTPADPLIFVAVKGQDGLIQIADDDLLDDPAIVCAIDEETEFNALVEEEAALLDSLLGERL